MKKLLCLSVIALAIYFNALGQIDSFNLSNYKLPEFKRHLLETTVNLSGNNQSDKSNYDPSQIKSYNYSGDFTLRYLSYLNSTKRQTEATGYLNVNGQNSMNQYSNEKSKLKQFYPALSYYSINRWYNPNKAFFELDYMLSGSFYKYKKEDNSVNSTDNKTINASIVLPIKFGTGRIEQVQDARHAIYILDELNEQNRISGSISDENLTKFAEHISRLKNMRFFDERIRKIYEVESIDSFLRTNNIIENSDAKYFTTLIDMWYYGGNQIRNSGTRIAGVIVPGVGYNKQEYSQFSANFKTRSFILSTGIELDYEKPINLYWQNSISFKAFYQIVKGKADFETDYKIISPNIQVMLSQKFGFFPNTRTSLYMEYGGKYAKLFDKGDINDHIIGGDNEGFMVFTGLNLYYYISPKFRFTASIEANYMAQRKNSDVVIDFYNIGNYINTSNNLNNVYNYKSIKSTFNLGIVYSIF